MAKLYNGIIDRLVIVAGPSGSGKSGFLKDPQKYLSQGDLPNELRDLCDLAKRHEQIMSLHNSASRRYDNLCLHVDITQPIRWKRPRPKSRRALLRILGPELFSEWPQFVQYTNVATTIDLITFFVRREEHFRRWLLCKGLGNRPGGCVRKVVAAVNGDSTNNDELHRAVYGAWMAFSGSLNRRSHHILDANSGDFRFISERDFRGQIENGYKR